MGSGCGTHRSDSRPCDSDRVGLRADLPVTTDARGPWSPADASFAADTWVNFAVYALYPRLRLTASELAELAAELAPLFRHLVTGSRVSGLTVEPWFAQSGTYLQELYGLGADPIRVERLVRTTMLSRYVGKLRWFLDGDALADVVCDTTDIRRGSSPYLSVLGIFFFPQTHAKRAAREAAALMPWATLV